MRHLKFAFGSILGVLMLATTVFPAFAQTDEQIYSDNQSYNNSYYQDNNDRYDQDMGYRQSYRFRMMHFANGNVTYRAYSNVDRHAQFDVRQLTRRYRRYDSNDYSYDRFMNNYGSGTFRYWDESGSWYTVNIRYANFDKNEAWFAGRVVSGNVGNDMWLFAKVKDGRGYQKDIIWGSFTDQNSARVGVMNRSEPADGPFEIDSGYLVVR